MNHFLYGWVRDPRDEDGAHLVLAMQIRQRDLRSYAKAIALMEIAQDGITGLADLRLYCDFAVLEWTGEDHEREDHPTDGITHSTVWLPDVCPLWRSAECRTGVRRLVITRAGRFGMRCTDLDTGQSISAFDNTQWLKSLIHMIGDDL